MYSREELNKLIIEAYEKGDRKTLMILHSLRIMTDGR